MRLKFWRWAHRRAESMWHWIYYNKLASSNEKALELAGKVYRNVRYIAREEAELTGEYSWLK